ncbi:MAG: hypothetical protein K6G73_12220 [Marinilabiliaceae bacterium]|nr:hypothetical protein [Marinilabiliaceae bacterium]
MELTKTELNDKYVQRISTKRLFTASNFKAPKRKIEWEATASLVDVKRIMWQVLCHTLRQIGTEPVIMREQFADISEWLHHNDGRGLFLYGKCGQGKTLLAKYVIPTCLEIIHTKMSHYYDIVELQENHDALKMALWYGITIVDDVGVEAASSFKDQAFARLIDNAEKNGKIVIATSNFGEDELRNRYGERTLDRIKGNMKRVLFDGENSLRK